MRLVPIILGIMAFTALSAEAAENIPIPNGSFESPTTTYASPFIDSWQKTAKPDWYDEGGGAFLWSQLTGQFSNQPPSYIDNCDGKQAAWMFVIPQVGIFQDYDYPTNHAFNAIYEIGKSYRLTLGIIGTGGGMLQGATIELALYYRDVASNMVVISATSITNLSDIFSNNTHFLDFHTDTPFVKPSDPWEGQHIGVRILSSITDTNMEGGYWDLDNARLTAIPLPTLTKPVWTNGQFSFLVQSEPGIAFEVQKASILDELGWSSLGFTTNVSGTISVTDTNASSSQSFYRLQLTQ
jgi:hypothetical protein